MSTSPTEADAERVSRTLADRILRYSAEARDLPRTCRLVRCRRTGQCLGQPQACRAALDDAVAAERAAAPPDDPWDGLAVVRQALLIAIAQKEAEAAAELNNGR